MIADILLTAAMQNTIPRWLADADAFRGLFLGIQTDVVDEWRTALLAKPPKVRLAYARGHDQFPLVVVSALNERTSTEPLRAFGRVLEDGTVEEGMLCEHTLTLTSMAQTAELARALASVVRASAVTCRDLFLAEGYVDFRYTGAEALLPEEELIAEDQGVFVRRQTVVLSEQVAIPPLGDPPTSLKLLVLASDLTVSPDGDSPTGWSYDAAGTAGGAAPQE